MKRYILNVFLYAIICNNILYTGNPIKINAEFQGFKDFFTMFNTCLTSRPTYTPQRIAADTTEKVLNHLENESKLYPFLVALFVSIINHEDINCFENIPSYIDDCMGVLLLHPAIKLEHQQNLSFKLTCDESSSFKDDFDIQHYTYVLTTLQNKLYKGLEPIKAKCTPESVPILIEFLGDLKLQIKAKLSMLDLQ